jgi:ABC-type branched-subunit amino acid transport system substrate-binding protein
MKLVFDSVNRSRKAHTFTLISRNDDGRPEQTVAVTASLMAEAKPTVLAGYFGTRNIDELVASGMLDRESVALVGFRTWNIRDKTPLLFSVTAGVGEEVQKMVQHLATVGIVKLALVYEETSGSASLLAATREASAKANAQLISAASYPGGTTRVASAVDAMLKASPQAVLLVTSGAAASAFIEQYRAAGGTAQIFAHSGADVEQMSKRLSEEQLKGVVITQVTPSPYTISSRLAKEMNELHSHSEHAGLPVSYAMIEGFITAKVIVEAARRQPRAATRESMLAALDSLENFDLGGYVVTFKGQRVGSRYVTMTIVDSNGRTRE